MTTYREIVYMISDRLKLYSDDSNFTIEHFRYLANKVRAQLLEAKYKKARRGEVPKANYQTICLDLIQVPQIPGSYCDGVYLRTTEKIPQIMEEGIQRIYPVDYFSSEIFSWVSMERFMFVGHNRWLQNMIYAAKGPDDYVYLTSMNPQFLYLRKLQINAVFSDPEKAYELDCSDNKACDILDKEFPIEDELVPVVIDTVYNMFVQERYTPEDKQNNADDDMSGMINGNK